MGRRTASGPSAPHAPTQPSPGSSSVDPATPEEWQEAVDAAWFMLCLDAARQYGLITGGPGINQARCEDLLRRGKALGYRPTDDERTTP